MRAVARPCPVLGLILGLLVPALPVAAQAPAPASDGVDLEVEDVPLQEALAGVARASGRTILVDPAVSERITISLREVPWRECVDLLARMTRCDVEEQADGVLWVRPRAVVTIQFADAEVRTVLQLLAAYGGKDIVVTPDVVGRVSVDLKEVPWRAALEAITGTVGLHARVRGDLAVVSGAPLDGPAWERSEAARGPWRPDAAADAAPVDLDVEDADLGEVLHALAQRVGRSIVLAPTVAERVTVALRRVPWPVALEVLARLGRCRVAELPGGVLYVHQPPRVTIQLTQADVRPVLWLLAAYSGRNVVVLPEVQGTVTLDLKEVLWSDALETLALALGLHLGQREGDGVVVVAAAPLEGPSWARWRRDGLRELDPWEPPGTGRGPWERSRARVDVSVRDADVREVVAQVARRAGVDVRVAPDVRETVSVALRDVPWTAAVSALAVLARCRVVEQADGVLVLAQGPRHHVQLGEADLRTALEVLAEYAGVDLALAPEVRGTVSLDLAGVAYAEALELAVHAAGGHELRRDARGGLVVRATPAPEVLPPAPAPPDAARLREEVQALGDRLGAVEAALAELVAAFEGPPVAPPPAQATWPLQDQVGLLDAVAVADVRRVTGALEHETGVQLAVLIVATTGREDPRAYGVRVFNAWGVGRAEANDGLLLLVAVEDRAAEIVSGAGIDERFDRPRCERILEEELVPRMRAGQPIEAVVACVERIAREAGHADPALQGALERAVDDIVRLAEERQVERMAERFAALRDRLNEHADLGRAEEVVRARLAHHRQRLAGLDDVGPSIALQLCITRGNRLLLRMRDLIASERYAEVLDARAEVQALVERMRAAEQVAFHRNAEALAVRAEVLAQEARALSTVARLTLEVRGLVLDDARGHRAIVNGRPVREGDAVVDPATGQPIPGLRVVRIARSTVTFEHEGTQLVRELAPR